MPSTESVWREMRAWLVQSTTTMATGSVLEVGPAGADDDLADSAQIHRLRAGTYLVRLSRRRMDIPMLADYSVPARALDRWHHDGRFPDCTDGYLFTRSHEVIADLCVAWFRDRCGVAGSGDLGFGYTVPCPG